MYTFLDHAEILKSMIWMSNRARKMHIKNGKRTRSKDRYILISKTKNPLTGKKDIWWSSTQGSEKENTFTIDDLINIVIIDLNNSYVSRGTDIFHQTNGCPMGGFLSAIYANVKCAYDEFNFLKDNRMLQKKIFGIRQMDDLFLMIAYTKNDLASLNRAIRIKNNFLQKNKVYKGGLELEEQKYIHINKNTSKHDFAGTNIYITQPDHGPIEIICKPMNKNLENILSETDKNFLGT